jgi:hypothetical protein
VRGFAREWLPQLSSWSPQTIATKLGNTRFTTKLSETFRRFPIGCCVSEQLNATEIWNLPKAWTAATLGSSRFAYVSARLTSSHPLHPELYSYGQAIAFSEFHTDIPFHFQDFVYTLQCPSILNIALHELIIIQCNSIHRRNSCRKRGCRIKYRSQSEHMDGYARSSDTVAL